MNGSEPVVCQALCVLASDEEQCKYEHCLGLVSRLLRAMVGAQRRGKSLVSEADQHGVRID